MTSHSAYSTRHFPSSTPSVNQCEGKRDIFIWPILDMCPPVGVWDSSGVVLSPVETRTQLELRLGLLLHPSRSSDQIELTCVTRFAFGQSLVLSQNFANVRTADFPPKNPGQKWANAGFWMSHVTRSFNLPCERTPAAINFKWNRIESNRISRNSGTWPLHLSLFPSAESTQSNQVNVYGAWDSPEIVSSIAVRLFAETPLQKSIDSINYF